MAVIMNSILPVVVIVVASTALVSMAVWTSLNKFVTEQDTVEEKVDIRSTSIYKVDKELLFSANSHDLFKENSHGFADYRLPAMVYHRQYFFAFCEGRKDTADSSVSQIVMKRGLLNGTKITWDTTLTVVAQINKTRLANPTPVVDKDTNTILVVYNVLAAHVTEPEWLALERYNQSVLITKSTDLGVTWEEPQNITAQTLGSMKPVPVFWAPGPGHGIQMKSGRLVIQGNYFRREGNPKEKTYKSNTTDHGVVFLSDDHGNTWRPGGIVPYAEDSKGRAIFTSESTVVELANGSLCLNSRTLSKEQPRAQSFSADGGETFSAPELNKQLIEPENVGDVASGCEGSVLGFPAPVNTTNTDKQEPWVLFSNPANSIIRVEMSVRLSTDGCKTWSSPWTIWDLGSGYSDLVQYEGANSTSTQGPTFGIIYENGYYTTTSTVSFMTFNLDDVRKGIKATELRKLQEKNQSYKMNSVL